MPGLGVTVTIKRSGVNVNAPTVTLGHLGTFTGDQDGEVEIEHLDWISGMKVILPMAITDPSDNKTVTCLMVLTQGESVDIEMTSNAKYVPPSMYVAPE